MAPLKRNAGRVELGRGFENRVGPVLNERGKKKGRVPLCMHLRTSAAYKFRPAGKIKPIGTAHITVVVVA